MQCRSCDSGNVGEFKAELAIHSPGLKNIDKPAVWMFPNLIICLDCGAAQFVVPEDELHLLLKGKAADQ
jgi:hypothetical protein